jgi:predicted lipoprotein with Yx(FWY)xxD motif
MIHMRGQTHRLRGIAVLGLLALAGIAGLLAAGSAAKGATHAAGTVSLRSTKFGKVLVNSHGRTLYLFTKDKSARSGCSGACASFWPPLVATSKPTAGAGINAALLGWTKRSDGSMQVTYNRHPLYQFAKDTAAGQVHGENLDAYGGEWYVVSAKGAKVEPGEHATSTSGSGAPAPTPTYTDTTNLPGY